MKTLLITLATILFSTTLYAANSHMVDKSINDEIFIINDETYEAKSYCFNVEEGDQVVFIEGSAYGACATAEFINLRTRQRCEVWCE